MHWRESRHGPGGIVISTQLIMRYGEAMDSWEELIAPVGTLRQKRSGALVHMQLNLGIRRALARGAQWVWVTGDDHGHRHDVLMRLLDLDVPVAAPLVLGRLPPFWTHITRRTPDTPSGFQPKPLQDMPPNRGLYTLAPDESCGDAGLLIRRDVLEKLGDPWYRPVGFPDIDLTQRIRVLGYPIVIDMSQRMSHIAPVSIEPVLTDNGWFVQCTMTGDMDHITGARASEPFVTFRMNLARRRSDSEANCIVVGREVVRPVAAGEAEYSGDADDPEKIAEHLAAT